MFFCVVPLYGTLAMCFRLCAPTESSSFKYFIRIVDNFSFEGIYLLKINTYFCGIVFKASIDANNRFPVTKIENMVLNE